MRRLQPTKVQSLSLLALVIVGAVAVVGIARRGGAQSDSTCLAQFQGLPGNENGGVLKCTDCDPSCDQDGTMTADGSCTFNFRICANQAAGSCLAGDVKQLKVVKKSSVTGPKLMKPGTSSACGAFIATVKTKGKKVPKPGTTKVKVIVKTKDKRKDVNTLTLECDPLPSGATCVTTTTSISTTTTTTIVCGNGVVEGSEVCDPPCQSGGACTSGMVCNSSCTACVPGGACACGTPAQPSQLKFTTGAPDIGSGDCSTTDGTVVGTVVDDSGAILCNLRSGGLYFGGAGVADGDEAVAVRRRVSPSDAGAVRLRPGPFTPPLT